MTTIRKALIVDDDEINNFICVRQIRASAFAEEAEFILNGREALETLRSQAERGGEDLPDVIFLDISMPTMNAWEFIHEYKSFSDKFPKPIKLFILSSSVYKKDVSTALKHEEVVDYLYKPLTRELLAQVKEKYFS